jgi:hypothetical protein
VVRKRGAELHVSDKEIRKGGDENVLLSHTKGGSEKNLQMLCQSAQVKFSIQ